MKKYSIYVTTVLLFVFVNLVSCKKDALHIDQQKRYYQINASPGMDAEVSAAIILTLYPKGEANLIPGGDIGYASKYKIKGKEITVEINPPNPPLTSYFTIISDTELHGKNGEILMLHD
ncbi:hypothetical protein DBR11_11135 [Pedobacter sp. HMWF019]|uniref:hypothetical protein n=1 Tax=Pedobacter sp. HMWF019 TaxID=2056856 RepID=UPI000D36CC2C|nr:hypothetical protein [Pedobacter sp. HMWF019]PTT00001.1 hypothetical protein DBR11_11135 [Pedobacter sp. HMWF019]